MLLHADLPLARRVESAFARMVAAFVEALTVDRADLGGTTLSVAGGVAAFAGVGSPITQAVGLGMDGPVSESDLDRLEAFYFDRESPVRVIVCPLADPSLAAGLGARGYWPVEFENLLIRRVEPGATGPEPPAGVVIEPSTPAEAAIWSDVMAQGFAGHREATPDLGEIARAIFGMELATSYLARVDGVAAGGASLYTSDGMAMLAGSSVLAPYRNRGVHTAMLHARLVAAGRLGCDLAYMGAEPGSGSQRNVERLGFRVAYTRVGMLRERRG